MKPLVLNIDPNPKIKKIRLYAKERSFSFQKGGELASSTKGQGLEFAGYRSYFFGDDAKLIDWKASLRVKELVIREFEEERILNVVFIFDVSDTMLFTSHKKLKAEYGAELINSLANGLINNGDAAGLLMVGDTIKSIYPSTSARTYKMILNALLDKNNYGGSFSFKDAIKYVIEVVKSNALIVIVSDFIGLEKDWYKWLEIASKMFDIIGICIRDPVDRKLPEEPIQLLVEDPSSGEKLVIDAKQYAKRYNEYVRKQEEELREWFKKTKNSLIILETNKDFVEPVLRFLYERYKVIL